MRRSSEREVGGVLRAVAAVLVVIGGGSSCEVPTRPRERADGLPAAGLAAVLFRYISSVSSGAPPVDPEKLTGCLHHWAPVAGAGPTLRGSWSENLYRPAEQSDEVAVILVPDVPVGAVHVARVYDLRLCNLTPSEPVSYRTLYANGVLLTRVVTLPSGATGVAFSVGRDGIVTP